MPEALTYRNREVVSAYQIAEPGEAVNTRNGIQWAPSGSWVVFTDLGVIIRADAEFNARYALWDPSIPALLESDLDPELYTPVGQTVDQVVAYLAANPGDVDRVKEIERNGANRKGIMEYA